MVVISREGSNPGEFIAQNEVLRAHQQNIHIVTEWITNDGESCHYHLILVLGMHRILILPENRLI